MSRRSTTASACTPPWGTYPRSSSSGRTTRNTLNLGSIFLGEDHALRHPVTVLVGVAALLAGGGLAVYRMKVDVFPSLNLPVVYVCQPYSGMDPAQMEGLIANYYEYHFLYVGGIHHVESKNVQGVSLMKLFFHPGTDMAQAMAR